MITETTRDNALIAAANGKPAFVISQKGDCPEVVNLTKMLHNVLTEQDNIFIADMEVHPEVTVPSLSTEPAPIPTAKEPDLKKVKGKSEFVKEYKPHTGGRKSKLDDGKIMALHNAGWSEEKIAIEMDVSQPTIHQHLVNMREGGRA